MRAGNRQETTLMAQKLEAMVWNSGRETIFRLVEMGQFWARIEDSDRLCTE